MKTSNAAIDPVQAKTCETWRPPSLRAVGARRSAAAADLEPPPISVLRGLGTEASGPPPAMSSELTICGSCRATARTQRASTLSSLGWRLGFLGTQAPGRAHRWFCPRCRDQADSLSPRPQTGHDSLSPPAANGRDEA